MGDVLREEHKKRVRWFFIRLECFRVYITFASMAFLHSGLFFRQRQRGFWLYHEVLKGVLSGDSFMRDELHAL